MNGRNLHSLDAVERVRRVREQDSLAGLHLALREVESSQQQLTAIENRLADLSSRTVTTPEEFIALRQGLLALGQAVDDARESLEAARNLAVSAQSHWQQDRIRLRTIEMLQERRIAQAQAEHARAQAKVQDEVAGQQWRRQRHLRVVS
ncbi:flagellar export protein FliJ [Marmoricola sp. URHB0036]|uniref:flagellar export protein FliJ n=1 Tax=Marmoricola sp. URHB0036 TaxID=1298863 RepID=UPI000418AAF3|nr:flagellar FliJ family protein [Marmoricola sp. URHB0036]